MVQDTKRRETAGVSIHCFNSSCYPLESLEHHPLVCAQKLKTPKLQVYKIPRNDEIVYGRCVGQLKGSNVQYIIENRLYKPEAQRGSTYGRDGEGCQEQRFVGYIKHVR